MYQDPALQAYYQKTIQVLQQLQAQNATYAVDLIAFIEKLVTDPGLRYPSHTEAQRFAVKWHCAKQYAIFVLGVAAPTPEFVLEVCRSLYPRHPESTVHLSTGEIESAIADIAEAIREFVAEISRIRKEG